MPISPLTISDLHKTTAHFDFLLTARYVKIETIPPNARSCAICHKPFEKDLWQLGTIVNRPVKLECGHKLGIKCLAHLVFASDFRNRCPVCSAQVISDSFERNPSKQSWKVMVPLLRTLTMFGGDDVAFNKERALEVLQEELNKKGLMRQVPGKHMHRLMVLYVEFLGRFGGGVRPSENADRVRAAERGEQRLEALLAMSREVRRLEHELRGMRAQEEERVRDERERELEDTRKDLEAAKGALKMAAGGFPDAQLGSGLMMLGATLAVGLVYLEGHPLETSTTAQIILCMWLANGVVAPIRSLLSRSSRVFIGLVMFGMALGWAL